jgi:hypothetical protein
VKTVAEFTPKDPALDRAITEFQSNVSAAIGQLERDSAVEPQVVQARVNGTIVRPGQLAVVDGSVNFELLLSTPRPDDEGRVTVVVKQKPAGTLTLRPVSSQVNAAATAALTNVGRYELQVAGGQYWRAP